MTGVECVNCHATMNGSPCSVCGYRRRRPALYPIGHDALTDSYLEAPSGGSPAEPLYPYPIPPDAQVNRSAGPSRGEPPVRITGS